jgi:hypothetical protein
LVRHRPVRLKRPVPHADPRVGLKRALYAACRRVRFVEGWSGRDPRQCP